MVTKDKYEVIQSPEEAAIIVKSTKKLVFTLTIHLTSPLIRTEQESPPSEAPPDAGTCPPRAQWSQFPQGPCTAALIRNLIPTLPP